MEKSNVQSNSSTEGPKKLHHRAIAHVQKHRVKWLAVLFGAVIVLLVYMLVTSISTNVAKQGDKVKVNYIGTLDDGSVFDTSLADVAKSADITNSQRTYEPLEFTIGNKEVLTDFENAVIGMKPGETKKFRIDAEGAYPRDPAMVVTGLPVEMILQTSYNAPIASFENAVKGKAEIGKEYTLTSSPLKIKVTAINSTNVAFAPIATLGEKVQMPYRQWSATITSINETAIVLKQDVRINQKISVNGQIGRVVEVNRDKFTIDLNLEIAGKPLNFEVSLVEIVKA